MRILFCFPVVVLLFVPARCTKWPPGGLVDHPDSRKQHFAPTPVGGIAMFLAFLLSSLTLGLLEQMPWGFFLGAAMVLAWAYDDIRPLGSKVVCGAGRRSLLAVASSGNFDRPGPAGRPLTITWV
jgi:UDP-N-acetylmuramyl pentapeptide phosphotransferase/UDP-N-acetylglucosamine-1-phosphate transferase